MGPGEGVAGRGCTGTGMHIRLALPAPGPLPPPPSPLAVAEGHAQDAGVGAAADGLQPLVARGAVRFGDEARQHHYVRPHVLCALCARGFEWEGR